MQREPIDVAEPTWSLREFAGTFYVRQPAKNPDSAWAFASCFMFVLAYALDRPTEDLRPDRRDRVRPGDVRHRHRHRQQLQRLPRRHGHRRPRHRPVHGRRPRACCRRAARTKTTMPRISACSTSPALFPVPSRRRSRPSSWRSLAAVTAVTACCRRSPGSARSSEAPQSCP